MHKPKRRRKRNSRDAYPFHRPARSGAVLKAVKGKLSLWYDGKHFRANKANAHVFPTFDRAKVKARELMDRFPVLKTWTVFSVGA